MADRKYDPTPEERTILDSGKEIVLKHLYKGPIYSRSDTRFDDYIAVVDLISRCSRQIFFSKERSIPISNIIWPRDKIVFSAGKSIEKEVVGLVSYMSPERIYGDWICVCGQLKYSDKTLVEVWGEEQCVSCGSKADQYKGLTVFNEEYKIVGAVDLVLRLGTQLYITEIKTRSSKRFKELQDGEDRHNVLQGMLYWDLVRRAGYPVIDKFSMLYINRDYSYYESPFQEVVHTVSEEEILTSIGVYYQDALNIKNGIVNKLTRVCASEKQGNKIKCPCVLHCFRK